MQVTRVLIAIAAMLSWLPMAYAQAEYTASRPVGLSSFSALASRDLGFGTPRTVQTLQTLAVTLGAKRGLIPTIELRMYRRMDKDAAVSADSGMAGIVFAKGWGNTRLYGNVSAGRSQFYYGQGGMRVLATHTLYDESASNVYGLGAGLDRRLSERIHLRLDVQLETFRAPVRESRLYSVPVAFGFDFHLPCRKDGHPY